MAMPVTALPRALVAPPLVAVVLAAGPVAVALAVAASGAFAGSAPAVPGWAPAVALAALVAGVPHGAVDHLALVDSPWGRRRLELAAVYLALAATAAAAVVLAPAPAFIVVLAMSVWHFGTGDVALADELARVPRRSRSTRMVHVLAAGSVPVLLPLTSAAATATLVALEPRLSALTAPGLLLGVRVAVLVLAAVAVALLLRERRVAPAGEVALLVLLALTVTPLRAVLRDGLPSLVVTLVAVAVAVGSGATTSTRVLWFALAAVWGLTVPHMMVVGATTGVDAGQASVLLVPSRRRL